MFSNNIRLDPTSSVQLVLNETIKDIFKIYEETRPKGLQNSIVIADNQNDEDPSLMADVIANAAEGAAVAGVGALTGYRGVIVGAAWGAGKAIKNHFVEWYWGDTKTTITTYNLKYLESNALDNIKNDILSDDKKVQIQKLYNVLCQYQRLKGTRFGLNILGFKIGEYRDDGVIDDPKYLMAILIGRKLKAIAEAKSKDEAARQEEHLVSFLEKIANNEKVLQSNSNDTAYLSLRSVINKVKKDLILPSKERENRDEVTKWLDKLNDNLSDVPSKVNQFVTHMQKRISSLTTAVRPDVFSLYQQKNESNINLTELKNIDDNGYLKLLAQTIWATDSLKLEDKKAFIAGFRDHSNIKENNFIEKTYIEFEKIIQLKNELQQQMSVFSKIQEIVKLGGNLALISVIPNIQFLLEKIRNTEKALVDAQNAFVLAIEPGFSNSSKHFKDAFTAHGFVRAPLDLSAINDALMALCHLSTIDGLQQAVEDKAKNAIDTFKKETLQLGQALAEHQSAEPQPTSTASVSTGASKVDDEKALLNSWVMVEVEKSNAPEKDAGKCDAVMQKWVKDGISSGTIDPIKLPEEIVVQPWYRRLFAPVSAPQLSQDQDKKTIEKLQAELSKVKSENVKLNTENTRLATMSLAFTKVIEKLSDDSGQIHEIKREMGTLKNESEGVKADRQLGNDFSQMIAHYTHYNEESFSLFHFHGKKGRDAASKLLAAFNKALTDKHPLVPLSTFFKDFVSANLEILTGNYNGHSLRTYLIAFHGFLHHTNKNKNITDYLDYKLTEYQKLPSADIKNAFSQLFPQVQAANNALPAKKPEIKKNDHVSNFRFVRY